MKSVVFCPVLLLVFFVLFACAAAPSASPPAQAPASAGEKQDPEPQPQAQSEQLKAAAPERAQDLIFDGAEAYKVVRRDTLSRISRTKYRNGFYYPLIIMASRDIVEDQDYIEAGAVLTIPNLQANLADAVARASMKTFFLEIADLTERRYKRPRDAAGLRRLANSF